MADSKTESPGAGPRFGIVAGERSGDILGAGLIEALLARYPDASFVGIGGPEMEALGCQSLAPMDRLSVMGFVEPLGRLPELLGIKRDLQDCFLADPPAAFIGIDSPDFNLRLAAHLKPRGIPTVHYVSPSVWAYRAKRIHGIKRSVDLMLTLFPFETAIYREHGVPVRCVGHPLADQIDSRDRRAESRERLGLRPDDRVLTLMPGSRSGEIQRLAPDFIAAALDARQHLSDLKFLIPCAGAEARLQIESLLRSARVLDPGQFALVDDSRLAISAANLVLMASGTATLEAMLLRRPMIVCYKLARLTWALATRIVKVDNVALPNLLAGRRLVPEYLQDEVKAAVLRDEILNYFAHPERYTDMLDDFARLHDELRRDASRQAAEAVAELVGDTAR